MSDKALLSSASRSLRLGCPDIEKCIEPSDDSNNEVLNVELSLNWTEVNTLQLAELETAPSSQHFGQVPSSAHWINLIY